MAGASRYTIINRIRSLNGVPPMNEVTRILSAIEQGEPAAAEQLLPLVYDGASWPPSASARPTRHRHPEPFLPRRRIDLRGNQIGFCTLSSGSWFQFQIMISVFGLQLRFWVIHFRAARPAGRRGMASLVRRDQRVVNRRGK
jgi:hypothetical protein